MSGTHNQEDGPGELVQAWERATDDDVLSVAFPEHSSYSNEALAAVYHEFVRRELPAPSQSQEHPQRDRLRPSRFSLGVRALGIYLGASIIWCAALAGTGALTISSWTWSAGWMI